MAEESECGGMNRPATRWIEAVRGKSVKSVEKKRYGCGKGRI